MKKIFYSVRIHLNHLRQIPSYFGNNNLIKEISSVENLEYIKNFKISTIDPFVNGIIDEIFPLASYSKHLLMLSLEATSYFIFPSICVFTQLTSLKIVNCTVGFKDFIMLISNLNCLERLDIYELKLLKLSNEVHQEDEILLPATLKEISFYDINLSATDLISTPYEFVFKYNKFMDEEEFYLPAQYLPNLKRFQLHFFSGDLNYIPKFLSFNPQLPEFTLAFCNFTVDTIKTLAEGESIKKLTINLNYDDHDIFNNVNLPYLYSLSTLHILYIGRKEYDSMHLLINSCPNLTKLYLMLKIYDSNFLTSILDNLRILKSFKLSTEITSDEELDLTIFSKLQILKLISRSNSKIFVKLPSSPLVLKLIVLSFDNYIDNFNAMMGTYKDSSSWNIKLIGKDIICRVVNI
ncbi:hypothetical protein CONCODRAFT_87232 [Conidiobolus coronatus NRRL 28638]|uniref:RNI-like protein n=1 Tax=Conidiobolus coronatus (strain ATCC 28846 / CBS 209.66 / NRRL 28638) TaxID=796925 RepID=A0A137NVY1_CONC2|nr:hypothetical protein CONCODRAFT_87232 [Conidiobolus coronatus NRRL 28638]|eukprot:KXN66932.1 hypothetical protein CONCODRAFT_87232 [Conidiobolus coronatus NRRL 28638]